MAFEDRCSPNQANSPGPVPNKVPSTDSNPNPNDRSLKPYTCSIIPYKYDRPKSPIMYRKSHVTPTIPNPLEAYRDNQSLFYHPYYNGFIINGMHRPYDYPLSVYDPFPKDVLPRNEIPQENAIDEDSANLNFSISNILRPEFGLNAIKKTTNKKEGPKSGGPTQSILYKPYELAKSASDSKISRKIDEPISPTAEMSFKFAPLGKLSHTVASLPQMIKPQIFKDNSMHGSISSKEDFGFSANKVDLLHRRPDSANSSISTASSTVSSQGMTQGGTGGYATGSDDGGSSKTSGGDKGNQQWPAWVYCTRYSDRPSSGPRSRRAKKQKAVPSPVTPIAEDKRPRTAFSGSQLARLKREFAENRYLTEKRRQHLSAELGLNEAQIKIWFQNKRAKIKKASGQKNPLALQLMAQGLYNHTTASGSEDEDEIKVT